ncbi:hypothetical protein F5148DRAFT_1311069, partial [Russula earlei]
SKDVLCDVGEDNFDKAFKFLRPVIQGSADLGPRLSEVEVQNALDFCADLFAPVNTDAANALRKHLEGLCEDPHLTSSPEGFEAKVTGMQTKNNGVDIPTSTRKRSGTIESVRRWLRRVGGIEEQVESEPDTCCLPMTPSSSEDPSMPSRQGGTISSTSPSLQAPGHFKFHMNVAALVDMNAPPLPQKEIQTIAKDLSLLPPVEIGSATDAEAETQRILRRMNARRLIHREHSGLHSLEEEVLGAGYRMRLQRGRLGLDHIEALE